MTQRIAYLTGQYPRATDTFVQREIAALRAEGIEVITNTIRATDSSHHVGPEQIAEFEATFQVMQQAKNPLRLITAHLSALKHNPKGWLSALALAVRTRPPGLKALIWQFFYFLEAGVLARHLRQNDVTHLHNHFADSSCSVAMLTAEMADIPFSFTLHGPGIFFEPMHWRIDEKIARAAFVACISHFCRAQAMLFSDQSHWSRLRIVHCGVDPERYARVPDRTYQKRLLFVGRLDAVKGVTLLLDSFAQLRDHHPDAILRIIGDGPDRAALEHKVKDLGLDASVSFLGYRSQAEVAETLDDTDILVLPSFAEGLPVVLMEALAAKVPAISSQVAGVNELVETGVNGFTIPAGDLDSLNARLDQMLSDPAMLARMGEAGRRKVAADFNSATEGRWLAALMAGHAAGTLPPTLRPATPDKGDT